LLSVPDPGDVVDESDALERAQRHFGIRRRILDEQDVHWQHVVHAVVSSSSLGRLKLKIVSCPGELCAHTRPPCRTTTRFTIASPTPVPGNSCSLCRRWNTPNSLS